MVPLKIALKNFLSYGQTTQYIDFEPYNLICLSGKNGHGKSALLDALTWVLWGYARKAQSGARADENLVRLGPNTDDGQFGIFMQWPTIPCTERT